MNIRRCRIKKTILSLVFSLFIGSASLFSCSHALQPQIRDTLYIKDKTKRNSLLFWDDGVYIQKDKTRIEFVNLKNKMEFELTKSQSFNSLFLNKNTEKVNNAIVNVWNRENTKNLIGAEIKFLNNNAFSDEKHQHVLLNFYFFDVMRLGMERLDFSVDYKGFENNAFILDVNYRIPIVKGENKLNFSTESLFIENNSRELKIKMFSFVEKIPKNLINDSFIAKIKIL
ncbi:hypothetical protein [Mycoplasma procyoni]|uniref:hypothetical protein n=1 Tax=Mycoplasma procyoni TaxID=568784 RepID=UPI00197B1836|nr:hypothetical protein [Mycoplasma procyoni]MBN3535067.1 hypothetical protein [Mycoplasma procyoni]